ncbi:sugar transferase [Clostridium polynesiense]|uniref:sugar transferase n=1 Tax=Clostridium polynesiense TaxID=1325933 RepID=UPI0005906BD8|nr:sugar transferase [Clostridium polynesiense]
MRKTNLVIKRFVDIFGSGIGLIIISPILIITVILLEIFMPGPVFFSQCRVGKDGKTFNILKFRSMKVDKEVEAKHDFTKDAERMTIFGNCIRRFKIDELPQLINVFRGDMSLVGPRPTVKEQTDLYNDYQRQRLNMRPGMTGLAQVNGNVALSWEERIDYDVEYVNNFNILLDCKILIKTVMVVFCGENRFKNPKR